MKEGNNVEVQADAKVYVDYAAFAEGKSESFDSTVKRKRPQGVFLGGNDDLPGFLIALRTMKIGEISMFIVDPEYAYGDVGCPPRIPAGIVKYNYILILFEQSYFPIATID
jgi:FK506-binding protein 6